MQYKFVCQLSKSNQTFNICVVVFMDAASPSLYHYCKSKDEIYETKDNDDNSNWES